MSKPFRPARVYLMPLRKIVDGANVVICEIVLGTTIQLAVLLEARQQIVGHRYDAFIPDFRERPSCLRLRNG